MKIVFVGNHSVSYSSETHHCNSLESLGHEVLRLQEGRVSGELIVERCKDADLLVLVHTHGWQTEKIELLNSLKIPIISYHLDLWLGINREKELTDDPVYKIYDHWFVTDKLMVDWLNQNTNTKGHFLMAGVYDKECFINKSYNPKEFDYDVIFVGSRNYHPEWEFRPKLIDWLKNNYGNRFLHVGGDGDTGTVRGWALNRIYARSKIAVGDTLNIGFDYPWYSSDRLFESMGRGGFTIYPDIKGLSNYFKDGKHLAYYRHGDFDNLKKKIDYYLENESEREKIRLTGHEECKKNHTYVKRWQTILNEVLK